MKIQVEQSDSTLRPGMTTGNVIETLKLDTALYVPLEALGSDSGVAYVYKQSGGRVLKQEVVTGAMNDDEVVIEQGLAEGDRVVLTPPSDQAKLKLVRLTHQAN